MDIARAMALGGQEVYPDQCDFYSYKELLLRCCFCGQEVSLKKGRIRKSHFAHFAGTDPKQVEECELRASSYGSYGKNTQINSVIENRGQRLEIFQQHFISLIYVEQEKIVDNVKFNNWIYSIKHDNNQAINNLANDCIEYFLTHQKQMEVYCVYLKDDQPLLQQQIALEAVDYLCVKSSYRLLKYIIYYCIYQLDKQNLTKNNIDSICHRAIKIIMLNPWIKALDNKNIKSSTINLSQLFEPEIVKIKSPSPLQISSQNIQNASQLYDLEQAKVNSKWIGSGSIDMDINQINAIERHALENKLYLQLTFTAWEYGNVDKETGLPSRKKVFLSCKLITEVNPDDKTALRFSFMTSKNVNFKVTTETYLPAVVYSFGYDFSLTVEKYSDLLLAKNGKLMEYPHITKRDELASLVERMIKDNKVEFIKTYIDHKGKKQVLHTYDDTVLILLALKRRTQLDNISMTSTTDVKKGTYNQIKNQIVMEAFIEAYERSLECSVILSNTTIDNYHRYAQFKLNEAKKRRLTKKIVKPKPTTTNRINTGLLGNWSQPFFLQLEPGQYLADKLGTEPVQCQVAMENQLLILYTLDKSFTRSEAIKACHSKKSFSANLTQQRTKLLTIGTIELSQIPLSKWSATHPQYETLAKYLNKSTLLPESIQKQYNGLILTNETLSIGDRVLCKKNVIGNKVLVKSYLDSKYCESHNQPKFDCIWLDQLRNDITKKMLQANYKEVKQKVENYVINNSDIQIYKTTYDVAKCTQSARSVVRQYQPSASDSDIGRLALLITEYIFTKLNLNKQQAVDLLMSLKRDVNQYVKIRDLIITPSLSHLKQVLTSNAVFYK